MAEPSKEEQSKFIWKATPKQWIYLAAAEHEVLYGGAAGGGKTDALVIDALGMQEHAIEYRAYQGLLTRRTLKELRDVIDRSQELYPQIVPGAKWSATEKVWTFPSGARIEMAYLESPDDRFRYQGRAFQFIGHDELAQHPSDINYRYLLSRNRTTETKLSCVVRASCNPGGAGHHWVQDYWRIPEDGSATNFEVDGRWRRFIPARLDDNPYLSQTGYRQTLESLSEQERKALLLGRWDVVDIEGSIYKPQLDAAFTDGRIAPLPIDSRCPVHTFWDLGRNDSNAIWFMQQVGPWYHFIDYYEHRLVGVDHYVDVLRERGYRYGTHYLPHDANVTEWSNADGETREEIVDRLMAGNGHTEVVPRIDKLNEGIEMVRQVFPRCRFDAERCAEGIKALQNYVYTFDEKYQTFRRIPQHNWASNGADAFRQFAQGYLGYTDGGVTKPAVHKAMEDRVRRPKVHRAMSRR